MMPAVSASEVNISVILDQPRQRQVPKTEIRPRGEIVVLDEVLRQLIRTSRLLLNNDIQSL